MADFLARLAQRTLGSTPAVEPVIAPMYAPGPVMAPESEPADAEEIPAPAQGGRARLQPVTAATLTPLGDAPRQAPPKTEPVAGEALKRQPVPAARTRSPARPVSRSVTAAAPTPQAEPRASPSGSLRTADTAEKQQAGATLDGPSRPASEALAAPPQAQPRKIKRVPEPPAPAPAIPPREAAGPLPASPRPEKRPGGEAAGLVVSPELKPSEPHPQRPPTTAAEDRAGAAARSASAPAIHVTIGRVEVRAVTPPAPAVKPRRAAPSPSLPLEEYLKQRNEGRR